LPCQAGQNLIRMTTGHTSRTLCLHNVPTFQKGLANVDDDDDDDDDDDTKTTTNHTNNLLPQFTEFDREACNGVVHVLNHVLLHKPLMGGLYQVNNNITKTTTIATSSP
jgi:hypothetical protein